MMRLSAASALISILALPSVASAFTSIPVASRAVFTKNTPLHAIAVDSSELTTTTVAATPPTEKTGAMMDLTGIALSGLKGQALSMDNFPKAAEIRAVLPADCFEPDTAKSLGYLSVSIIGTALCTVAGVAMLSVLDPVNPLTWPVWALYATVTGTVAMGLWVLAHECGHGAFSKNRPLQDAVGYANH